MRKLMVVVASVILAAGCTDKAKPNYEKCLAADKAGDLQSAWSACLAASFDDPNSSSGKAAGVKLEELRPRYNQWQADQAASLAAAQAATAQAQAARVAQLRAQATIQRTGEDDRCVSDGKPPRGLSITGGTYDDNYSVATSMRCVRSHPYHADQGHTAIDNYYCCP